MRAPATGLVRDDPPPLHPAHRRGSRGWSATYCGAGLGEVAGEEPDELLEVAGRASSAGTSARRGPRRRRRCWRRRGGGRPGARGPRRRPRPRSTRRCRPWRRCDDHLVDVGGVLGQPAAGRRGPRRTSTAPSAARHQASVPGRTCRWKSASSAVSVRRGSITIIDRAGSRAISFSVVRARGRPWLCHGFLPTKTARPRRARSRPGRACRASCRSPRTRRSSPGRARWSGTASRAPRGCPPRRRRPRWFPCPPPP